VLGDRFRNEFVVAAGFWTCVGRGRFELSGFDSDPLFAVRFV